MTKMFTILSIAILVGVIFPSGQADGNNLNEWIGGADDECHELLCALQRSNTTAPSPPTLNVQTSNNFLEEDPSMSDSPPIHWVFVWFSDDREDPIVSNPFIPLGTVLGEKVSGDPTGLPNPEGVIQNVGTPGSGNPLQILSDPSHLGDGLGDGFGDEVKAGATFNLALETEDRASPGNAVELLIIDGDIDRIEEIEEPGRVLAQFKERVKPDYGDMVTFKETPAVAGATYLLRFPGNQFHLIDPIYQLPVELPATSPTSISSTSPQNINTASSTSSTSTELARHNGIIVSDGEWGDEGTFITFSNIQANGDIHVTYKYCYNGQTNGRTAGIWTKFDGGSVDTNTFTTPHTGGSGSSHCSGGDSSTYASKSFKVSSASISNQIKFDYKNGDWKVSIAEIVVTAESGSNNNSPPGRASQPSGPSSGIVGTTYSYNTVASDPNGDNIRYQFNWGDGTTSWTNWVSSGQSVSASKSWSSEGSYGVKARAQDENGATGSWSLTKSVTISGPNNPPNTPTRPSGEVRGTTGQSYLYSTSTTDPDGNNIRYQFDWGDGTTTWSGLVSSGTPTSVANTWGSAGTYSVKVRAQDSNGAYSDWSLTRTVNISGSGHCSTLLEHNWVPGNYNSDWEEDIKKDDWLELGWGGWKYNWRYSSACDPNDSRTISSTAFGFGFTGHNHVSGKMVVDFGGNIQGERLKTSPGHHVKLDGMQFFYRENPIEDVRPFGGGLYGRSVEVEKQTCKDGPYGPLAPGVKAAITVASAKYWWLGFGTMVPDEYCKENWRSVSSYGGPGRGVKITGVESWGTHQMASGWINVDYTNVRSGADFQVMMRGAVDHYTAARGCVGCLYEVDSGKYYYEVTPAMKRAGGT